MKEKTNIKVGIVISYVTLATNILVAVFFTPFVLKKIGEGQYGLLSFVESLTSWLTILTSALGSAYIRYAAIETTSNGNPNRINTIYCKLFFVISVVICLIATVASAILFSGIIPFEQYSEAQKQIIPYLFVISSLQIVVSVLLSVFSLFNTYKKRFIVLRSLSLSVVVLNVILTIFSIFLGGNVIAIAIVHLITNVFSIIFGVIVALKGGFKFCKAPLKENKGLVVSLAIFSSFILINTIVDQINNSIDKTILGFLSSPETVTIYQLGQSFSTYLTTMSLAVSGSFIPKINELVAQKKEKEYKELFLKISWVQAFIIVFTVGGFAIAGSDFTSAWLDGTKSDPETVYILAIVLLVLYMVPLTENSSIEIQRALNKHKFRSVAYILMAVVNVILSVTLVRFMPDNLSVYGCLIGTIFAMVAGNWVAINIYNKLSIDLPVGKYLLMLASFIGMAGFSCAICFFVTNWIPWGNISKWFVFITKAIIYTLIYGIVSLAIYKNRILGLIATGKKKGNNTSNA